MSCGARKNGAGFRRSSFLSEGFAGGRNPLRLKGKLFPKEAEFAKSPEPSARRRAPVWE
jgi:hypothetical protein